MEDVGEAYTLTNWLHVDDVPRHLPIRRISSPPADFKPPIGWRKRITLCTALGCLSVTSDEGRRAGGGATSSSRHLRRRRFEPRDRRQGDGDSNPRPPSIRPRLRPRTQEDCRPLIELCGLLVQHLVIEMQSTYWAMSRHFKELERHLKEEYERGWKKMRRDARMNIRRWKHRCLAYIFNNVFFMLRKACTNKKITQSVFVPIDRWRRLRRRSTPRQRRPLRRRRGKGEDHSR